MTDNEISLKRLHSSDNTHSKKEEQPLINHKQHPNRGQFSCSVAKIVLLIFVVATISAILSNIDRIIESFKTESDAGSTMDDILKYDMVIVGGGISGLSNMHFQTMNDNGAKKRLLIEKMDRIGGRAISYNINYLNHDIIMEFGAMRIAENDYYVNRMLKRLGLCDDMIPYTGPGGERMFYYKNTMSNGYSNVTIDNYWSNLFEFTNQDLHILNSSNSDILLQAFNDILDENNNGNIPATEDEWYQFRNHWTLNNILIKDYSYKIFYENYLQTSIEFWNYQYVQSFYLNYDQSILEQLYNRYGPIEQYKNSSATPGTNQHITLINGYNDITWSLFRNVSSYDNNNFIFNEKLIAIDYSDDDDYKYMLMIQNTVNNTMQHILTNDIILSMDAQAITNNIELFKPIYTENTLRFVNGMTATSSYKVNMVYFINKTNLTEFLFFNKLYNIQGLSTDLSLRIIWMDNLSLSEHEDSVLFSVQIYSALDYKTQILHQLQETGQNINDLYPVDDNINFENNVNSIDNLLISSKLIVNHIKQQLSLLTDIDINDIPNPIASFSQPLGLNDSNAAGLVTWKCGIDHIDAMNKIFKLIQNETIYISSADYVYDHGPNHASGIFAALQILTKYFNSTDPFRKQPTC